MATLPTDEEKVRMVLDAFKHFGTRSGEVILMNNIVGYAAKNNLRTEDMADGIDKGVADGLFNLGKSNSVLLTVAGFAEV